MVVGIISLIVYYGIYNKLKMIRQVKILDNLVIKVHDSLVIYLETYLEYLNKRIKYLDSDIILSITSYINDIKDTSNISDIIIKYNIVNKLLNKCYLTLEDKNKINKKLFDNINNKYTYFNKCRNEYNYNTLIMSKYVNMFIYYFIAKIYKFKEYPYFINEN
jgi:hypothetical protein